MDTVQRDDRATVSVSPREIEQAREIRAALAAETDANTALTAGFQDRRVPFPPELTALMLRLVDLVGQGYTVTIGSVPNEVSTTVAAKMLRMSRPSLMKLVREGQIPAHKVGSHTRLFSKDVLAFRRTQLEHQRAAFDELRDLEEAWGVAD